MGINKQFRKRFKPQRLKPVPGLSAPPEALEALTILKWVARGSRVLDIGCGSGDLLAFLVRERGVVGRGVEIDQECVQQCIAKGLSVFHGDVDDGLADYPDQSYDVVLLMRTLQTLMRPQDVLTECLRVGRRAIVSIPNFGHWSTRASLMFRGRMPNTPALPYHWYNTPNIRVTTLKDMRDLCDISHIDLLDEDALVLPRSGRARSVPAPFANLMAEYGVFLLTAGESAGE